MGLDMYLYAKKYTSKHTDEELNRILWGLFPKIKPIDNINTAEVKLEVGYWRKANAIHKWFVDNVQGGRDDCGDYSVSVEQLKKLREDIKEILTEKIRIVRRLNKEIIPEKAKEKLPTQSGFFFGGTNYDKYYWDDVGDIGTEL